MLKWCFAGRTMIGQTLSIPVFPLKPIAYCDFTWVDPESLSPPPPPTPHPSVSAGARQFVENHFADTTIGRTRLLVDATFRRVRHLVEKIVRYDIRSKLSRHCFATKRRTRRNIASTKCQKGKIRNHLTYKL